MSKYFLIGVWPWSTPLKSKKCSENCKKLESYEYFKCMKKCNVFNKTCPKILQNVSKIKEE
jgi:hypothetical protein